MAIRYELSERPLQLDVHFEPMLSTRNVEVLGVHLADLFPKASQRIRFRERVVPLSTDSS